MGSRRALAGCDGYFHPPSGQPVRDVGGLHRIGAIGTGPGLADIDVTET
jgi:hypothetical protein